jgi:hypothetical protein
VPNILPNKELLSKAQPYVVPLIIILVGLTAFGLGRLSAMGGEGSGVVVRMPLPQTQAATVQSAAAVDAASRHTAAMGEDTQQFVASKSGSKYYLPSCPGAARIKQENRVYFASAAEARAAGYTPAANCPGL